MRLKVFLATGITMGVALAALAQQQTGGRPNLLTNPSFEDGQEGWEFSSWGKQGVVSIDLEEKREGKASLQIQNPTGDDSFLRQTVTVKPRTRYRLTGVIKTDEVVEKGAGATLSLDGGFEKSETITGRKSWTRVELEFETGPLDKVKVGPRLGHHGSLVSGKAWFDDLSLVELGPSGR
ncbi:MAG: carbohydrate binding domain-containing protein [Verrucomicrobiales bacterium]